jgi:3',5'-cyclic AMP phosphodiesterase CpdA
MNSAVCFDPGEVPEEWDAQLRFLKATLGRAMREGSHHIVVFAHHPLFLRQPDEEDSWAVIPTERRHILMDLYKENGVPTVFSGHWHRNGNTKGRNLELITTGRADSRS